MKTSTRTGRIPAPPAGLKKAAKARWRAVYAKLASRGEVDLELLGVYCQVWARWREAEDGIDKAGQLAKGTGGRIVQSPLVAIANQNATQVRALEDRLGLTAVAQPGSSTPDTSDDPTLLTRRQLAEVLRNGQGEPVHMQTITKWEHEGLQPAVRGRRGRPSLYRESDVRAWVAARDAAASNLPGAKDLMAERARKERAQAVLAEQTFQARARVLLPAAEVERLWGAEIQAVRNAIIATYTTQADRLLRAATLEGVGGIEAELKAIAYELLRELASPDRAIDVPVEDEESLDDTVGAPA